MILFNLFTFWLMYFAMSRSGLSKKKACLIGFFTFIFFSFITLTSSGSDLLASTNYPTLKEYEYEWTCEITSGIVTTTYSQESGYDRLVSCDKVIKIYYQNQHTYFYNCKNGFTVVGDDIYCNFDVLADFVETYHLNFMEKFWKIILPDDVFFSVATFYLNSTELGSDALKNYE